MQYFHDKIISLLNIYRLNRLLKLIVLSNFPQTWMYLIGPVLFYATERVFTKNQERFHRVDVIKVCVIDVYCPHP
jgi:hypothetical protein